MQTARCRFSYSPLGRPSSPYQLIYNVFAKQIGRRRLHPHFHRPRPLLTASFKRQWLAPPGWDSQTSASSRLSDSQLLSVGALVTTLPVELARTLAIFSVQFTLVALIIGPTSRSSTVHTLLCQHCHLEPLLPPTRPLPWAPPRRSLGPSRKARLPCKGYGDVPCIAPDELSYVNPETEKRSTATGP